MDARRRWSTQPAVRWLLATLIALWLLVALGPAIAVGSPLLDGADRADGTDPAVRGSLDDPRATEGVEIDPALEDATGTVTVVVRFEAVDGDESTDPATLRAHATETQAPFEDFADTTPGVAVERPFWLANAMLVTVDLDAVSLETVAAIEGVTRVHENFVVSTTGSLEAPTTDRLPGFAGLARDWPVGWPGGPDRWYASDVLEAGGPGLPGTVDPTPEAVAPATIVAEDGERYTYGVEQVGAREVWETFDVRGEGVEVAVLDTGVDPDHPDVDLTGWAEFDEDGGLLSDDPGDAHDSHFHGTHVSATIVGGDASGTHVGVAPGATLHHGRVLDGEQGTFAQILAGMEWAIADVEADVVSMSLGARGYDAELIEVVENAHATGTLVVAAVGNSGEWSSSTPANDPGVLSVGAVDRNGTVADFSSGDVIATGDAWGNETPDGWPDELVVPELTAPGVEVLSARPNRQWSKESGTSMATPHVAGVAALVLAADEEGALETPGDLRAHLRSTASRPAGHDGVDHRYGVGVVDALNATAALVAEQTVTGTVTDPAGEPIAGATVESGLGPATTTGANGTYSLAVPSLAQGLTVDALGYAPVESRVDPRTSTVHDVTVDEPVVDVELVATQPRYANSSSGLAVTYRLANVDRYTVDADAELLDPGDTTLSVNDEPVADGERVSIESDGTGHAVVTVVVDADPGTFGTIALEHTFEGSGGEALTRRTGPTTVHDDPVAVPADVPFDDIDRVLDLVHAGTTIELADGTYEAPTDHELLDDPWWWPFGSGMQGSLVVERPVTIAAAEGASPEIEVVDTTGFLTLSTGVAAMEDVELRGISIDGDGVDALVLGVADLTITDSELRDATDGILDLASRGGTFTNNAIGDVDRGVVVERLLPSEDGFDAIEGNTIDAETAGIEVVEGTIDVVRDNEFTGAGDGVFLQNGTIETVENNAVEVDGGGVRVLDGRIESIASNAIDADDGIVLVDVAAVDVHDNEIVAEATGITLGRTSDVTGENNEVRDAAIGFLIDGSDRTTLRDTAFDGVERLLEVDGATDTTLDGAHTPDADATVAFEDVAVDEVAVEGLTLADGSTVDLAGSFATVGLGDDPGIAHDEYVSTGTFLDVDARVDETAGDGMDDAPLVAVGVSWDGAVDVETVGLYHVPVDGDAWTRLEGERGASQASVHGRVEEAGTITVLGAPAGRIEGTIVGTITDEPIGGAAVRAVVENATNVPGDGVHETTSDADGRFTVDGVVSGESYRVESTPAGYRGVDATVTIDSSDATAAVTLAPGGSATIEGTVTDGDGRGVEGATVTAARTNTAIATSDASSDVSAEADASGSFETVTDENGSYAIEHVPGTGENYRIAVTHDDYEPANRTEQIADGAVTTLDFVLDTHQQSDDLPGFGVLGALAAIFVVAAVVAKRRR